MKTENHMTRIELEERRWNISVPIRTFVAGGKSICLSLLQLRLTVFKIVITTPLSSSLANKVRDVC